MLGTSRGAASEPGEDIAKLASLVRLISERGLAPTAVDILVVNGRTVRGTAQEQLCAALGGLDALVLAVAPGSEQHPEGALGDEPPGSRYEETSKVQNREEGCGRSRDGRGKERRCRKRHPPTPGSNRLPLLVPVRIHQCSVRNAGSTRVSGTSESP